MGIDDTCIDGCSVVSGNLCYEVPSLEEMSEVLGARNIFRTGLDFTRRNLYGDQANNSTWSTQLCGERGFGVPAGVPCVRSGLALNVCVASDTDEPRFYTRPMLNTTGTEAGVYMRDRMYPHTADKAMRPFGDAGLDGGGRGAGGGAAFVDRLGNGRSYVLPGEGDAIHHVHAPIFRHPTRRATAAQPRRRYAGPHTHGRPDYYHRYSVEPHIHYAGV